jgi:hypothetical protein
LVYGIERYVHLRHYETANAANRADPLIGGYDLATLPNEERSGSAICWSARSRPICTRSALI